MVHSYEGACEPYLLLWKNWFFKFLNDEYNLFEKMKIFFEFSDSKNYFFMKKKKPSMFEKYI